MKTHLNIHKRKEKLNENLINNLNNNLAANPQQTAGSTSQNNNTKTFSHVEVFPPAQQVEQIGAKTTSENLNSFHPADPNSNNLEILNQNLLLLRLIQEFRQFNRSMMMTHSNLFQNGLLLDSNVQNLFFLLKNPNFLPIISGAYSTLHKNFPGFNQGNQLSILLAYLTNLTNSHSL
jgi:hypothetical protein